MRHEKFEIKDAKACAEQTASPTRPGPATAFGRNPTIENPDDPDRRDFTDAPTTEEDSFTVDGRAVSTGP